MPGGVEVWVLEKEGAGWSRGCWRRKVSGGVEVWVLEKEGVGWSRGCWRRKVPGGVEVWVLEKESAGWSRGCWRREVGSVIRKLDSAGSVIRRLKNEDFRHCSTLLSFKARLKTFLFSQYFRPN